jgi:type II secretory pathway pseudopilin PulG
MRTGERGVTCLLLLFAIALIGATLAAIGSAWSTAAQRLREAELLHRGEQIRRAIGAYHRSTPEGTGQFPARLEDLLDDRRGPEPRRHLRQIYPDPFTGAADWVLIGEQGRIQGVHSRAAVRALRERPADEVAGPLVSDWRFEWRALNAAEPATAPPPSVTGSTP